MPPRFPFSALGGLSGAQNAHILLVQVFLTFRSIALGVALARPLPPVSSRSLDTILAVRLDAGRRQRGRMGGTPLSIESRYNLPRSIAHQKQGIAAHMNALQLCTRTANPPTAVNELINDILMHKTMWYFMNCTRYQSPCA